MHLPSIIANVWKSYIYFFTSGRLHPYPDKRVVSIGINNIFENFPLNHFSVFSFKALINGYENILPVFLSCPLFHKHAPHF